MLVAPDDFVLWDFLEARLGRNALHVPDGLTRWLVVLRDEIASSVETAAGALQGSGRDSGEGCLTIGTRAWDTTLEETHVSPTLELSTGAQGKTETLKQICRHVQVALNIMAKRNGVRRMFVTTELSNVHKSMI